MFIASVGLDLLSRLNASSKPICRLALLLFLLLSYSPSFCANTYRQEGDQVVMSRGNDARQLMNTHNREVLRLALERTRERYGPYTLRQYHSDVTNLRILHELNKSRGTERVNAHVSLSSPERELKMRAIPIPIRFGLLNYRLVLIRKDTLEAFQNIRSTEELRKYRVGSGEHWLTTKLLESNNFKVVKTQSYNSIFKMLAQGRYDFILRGVSEMRGEAAHFEDDFSNLVIAPDIAIYIPLYYHVFVGKNNVRLANRIQDGLEDALEDGSLRALFMHHYGERIKHANLEGRKIIEIKNPHLINNPMIKRPELWYFHTPDAYKMLERYIQDDSVK